MRESGFLQSSSELRQQDASVTVVGIFASKASGTILARSGGVSRLAEGHVRSFHVIHTSQNAEGRISHILVCARLAVDTLMYV